MGDGTVSEKKMIELLHEIRRARKELDRTSGLIRKKVKSSGRKTARIAVYIAGAALLILVIRISSWFVGRKKR